MSFMTLLIPEWDGVHIEHTAELFKVKHLRTQQSSHPHLVIICFSNDNKHLSYPVQQGIHWQNIGIVKVPQ